MVHFLKRLHFLLFFAVVYCGPTEWRFERRRGSSVDRKNTIRHLIQMMAITEEELKDADTKSTENSEEDDEDGGTEFGGIPVEFLDLFNDEELKQTLIDLILTASDLDILDFQVRERSFQAPFRSFNVQSSEQTNKQTNNIVNETDANENQNERERERERESRR